MYRRLINASRRSFSVASFLCRPKRKLADPRVTRDQARSRYPYRPGYYVARATPLFKRLFCGTATGRCFHLSLLFILSRDIVVHAAILTHYIRSASFIGEKYLKFDFSGEICEFLMNV